MADRAEHDRLTGRRVLVVGAGTQRSDTPDPPVGNGRAIAVQAAREASRRAQCSNHLKQIGLGFHLHHDTYKFLPTGGSGADPARTWAGGSPATGVAQVWNWAYQILPYIEQQNAYQKLDFTQSAYAAANAEVRTARHRPL